MLAEYLKDKLRGPNQNLELQDAAYMGLYGKAVELLKKGADPNATNKDSATSLHLAAYSGYLEIVKLLLENDAIINAVDNDDRTALFYASCCGHEEIVKYLLSKSAEPDIRSNNGDMCLHAASRIIDGLECIKVLVDYLPVNIRGNEQYSPLHYASLQGLIENATFY